MKRKTSMRLLSFLVMLYMLIALLWWCYLLYEKNNDVFKNQIELLKLEQQIDQSNADFTQSAKYEAFENKYQRQRFMILGEGLVFGLILVVGMWMINRAHRSEVENAEKQKNFLLSITHELRTPLASIKLILDTIRKRDLEPAKIKSLSTDAMTENDRLNTMIDKILLVTKLDKSYVYNFEPIDTKEILSRIINNHKALHAEAVINLIEETGPYEVEVDKESFVSLMNNLLENAIKYSGENPVIDVHLHRETEFMHLSVSDNGIGISDTEKPKVLNQFYRVGSEETRQTKGTGLGLYIVDKIVQAHGGKLTISDNEPKGTKVAIIFPVNQK